MKKLSLILNQNFNSKIFLNMLFKLKYNFHPLSFFTFILFCIYFNLLYFLNGVFFLFKMLNVHPSVYSYSLIFMYFMEIRKKKVLYEEAK
jgi:hypothetical protein